MTAPLRRVGMRRPGALLTADAAEWHYAKPLNPAALVEQYDHFVSLVEQSGAHIDWFDASDDDGLADSVFTYDPSFMTPAGAVVMRPGKALRSGEAELHADFYAAQGIDVIGKIRAPGTIEGGDCFWLNDSLLAVGRGFRTNQAGIDQLEALLGPHGVDLAVYDLPYLHGPDACLHLMSVVSPLADDLALVHAPLVPAALYQHMQSLGIELIHAPPHEFEASLGLNLNVLALDHRRVIAIDGFDETVAAMRAAECDVQTFAGDELCIPCEGGPTCLTRPLLRA